MTKELIERLRDTASKGVSVWGDLQMEAAKEIEILTAEREAYASAMDRMKAELVAIKDQEPVATLWRENNQKLYPGLLIDLTATGEALPTGVLHHLFAAPTTPVREPLTDSTIGEIWGFEAGKSGYNVHELPRRFARTIEAAHGIKEQK